jgi:thiamine-monophosphate kinase
MRSEVETVAPDQVVSDLTEADLIGRIKRTLPVSPAWLIVGIGDDAAVIEPERNRLEVLTVDALVEGVHFDRAFTPPEAIGHRALAANLSDLAAMGATPRVALLSLALPNTLLLADFDGIISGITALAGKYRVTVVGGNLTCTPGPLVIDITVTGTVKRRQVLTRAGAQPGDELYVSGTIGAAAAGLQMLRKHAQPAIGPAGSPSSSAERCVERYLYPDPRLRLGSLLGRNRAATACVDLSDGLSDAVRQLSEASGLGATIEASALPIEPAAREWFESFDSEAVMPAITGGDDYELLIAVRPRTSRRLAAALRHGNTTLTRIGSCTADGAMLLRLNGSNQPLPRGYAHFR